MKPCNFQHSLGVQTPAAETALIRALCREVCRNLAGRSVLDDEHGDALGDDTGTCADRVGVERRHDLDLAGLDQLDSIFIGLCPVLEAAGADQTALVQHDHVFVSDRRAGVDDRVVVQPLNDIACGQNINEIRLRINNPVNGNLVCRVNLCLELGRRDGVQRIQNLGALLDRRLPVDLGRLDALCDEGIVKERRTDVDDAKIALVFLFCHTTQPLSSSAARNALAILVLS